jgi:hypothetical protein
MSYNSIRIPHAVIAAGSHLIAAATLGTTATMHCHNALDTCLAILRAQVLSVHLDPDEHVVPVWSDPLLERGPAHWR